MRAAGLEPDAWQTQVAGIPGNQLWVCHRQSGKTTDLADLSLETACNKAGALVLLISPSLRQSGELFRKVKHFYDVTQPMPLLRDTALSLELPNRSRIISLPGTALTIVGFSSVDLLVLDEAARIPDAVYYAIRPMLAMSQGRLIAATTPYGKRGWFFEAWTGADDLTAQEMDKATAEALLADLGIAYITEEEWAADTRPLTWSKTFLPAPESPRLSKRFLANERRQVPDLVFRQEWLCEFVDTMDQVFRWEDVQNMLTSDVLPLFPTGHHREVLDTILSSKVQRLFGENANV